MCNKRTFLIVPYAQSRLCRANSAEEPAYKGLRRTNNNISGADVLEAKTKDEAIANLVFSAWSNHQATDINKRTGNEEFTFKGVSGEMKIHGEEARQKLTANKRDRRPPKPSQWRGFGGRRNTRTCWTGSIHCGCGWAERATLGHTDGCFYLTALSGYSNTSTQMIIWLSGFCIHDTVQWRRLFAAKQWCGERKCHCRSVGPRLKEKYHAAQSRERKYQYCWLWGDVHGIQMFLLLLFFIWFSGFRSDAKLFISRRKTHYSHVIWSFISGLFDQDLTSFDQDQC